MATCLVPCIQKIPNEMPIKWLIMTVSKYICICFSLEKWKQWMKVERGLITAITLINVVTLFCLLFEKKWCYFRKYIISKSVTNVRLGHLIYKITIMHISSAFLKKNLHKESKRVWIEAYCLPLGVSTCDFHLLLWLCAQQDIPERVFAWLNINSPSKQPGVGVSLAKSGLRFLLKINQAVHSLGLEISTCAARSHV